MKAFNVDYGKKVRVLDNEVMIPPEAIQVNKGDIITIYELDCMYCSGSKDGNRIYIGAMTNVELI